MVPFCLLCPVISNLLLVTLLEELGVMLLNTERTDRAERKVVWMVMTDACPE